MKHRLANILSFTAAMAALSACATVPSPDTPDADNGEQVYRAMGAEPDWTLSITSNRLDYAGDYGETRISLPRPEPRTSFNGHRYEITEGRHSLTVDITHARCSDGMSDRIYADKVMVIADGKTVNGCGGDIVPPGKLDNSSWKIISIGGTPVIDPSRASLAFADGRVSGSGGCNRIAGGYSETADKLKVGMLMSTQMACPGALMEQDDRLAKILSGEVAMRFEGGDQLILTGANGKEAVLQRGH